MLTCAPGPSCNVPGVSSEEFEELQQQNDALREALEGARQELLDAYKQASCRRLWGSCRQAGWWSGWLVCGHGMPTLLPAAACMEICTGICPSATSHWVAPPPAPLPQVADLEAAAGEVVLLESRAEAAEGERDEALEQLRAATPRPQQSWGALLELVGEAGAGPPGGGGEGALDVQDVG